MYYVADTGKLVADDVIDAHQADEIQSRARAAMVALCINSLLQPDVTESLALWRLHPYPASASPAAKTVFT